MPALRVSLALEQGLIHPLSILSDAPHSFGDYDPEHFDREFVGPIRACDALKGGLPAPGRGPPTQPNNERQQRHTG